MVVQCDREGNVNGTTVLTWQGSHPAQLRLLNEFNREYNLLLKSKRQVSAGGYRRTGQVASEPSELTWEELREFIPRFIREHELTMTHVPVKGFVYNGERFVRKAGEAQPFSRRDLALSHR